MRKRPEVRLFDMWNSGQFEEVHGVKKEDYTIPERGQLVLNVDLHSEDNPNKGIRKGFFTKDFDKAEDLFDTIDDFCCLGFQGVGQMLFKLHPENDDPREFTMDIRDNFQLTNNWALEILDAVCKN